MSILYFSDILEKVGLDPARVKLLRHSLNDNGFRECADAGMIYEYTCHQKADFSKNYDYWIVFVSGKSTQAKLFACYEVGDYVPDTQENIPTGFPAIEASCFQGQNAYYNLKPVDILAEYENRLMIDWGKATISWHQKGTTPKPVLAIRDKPGVSFPGYENVVLTYSELKARIESENEDEHTQWYTALSKVNAVYLIVDLESGQQYVGSAYGEEGLWGRWRSYVDTGHGNNKLMKELICAHPERYHHFQFSILQILPKTVTDEEVIHTESLYKRKLQSVVFGMNDN